MCMCVYVCVYVCVCVCLGVSGCVGVGVWVCAFVCAFVSVGGGYRGILDPLWKPAVFNSSAIILTSQYEGQGAYCSLSNASEMFHVLTNQLHTFLCNYNALFLHNVYIEKRGMFH